MKPITIIENIQLLYDRNEFLTAYHQTKELWRPETSLNQLSVEELILAARLSARLGGRRLWRWLFRQALQREPNDPKVRYFARYIHRRGWTLLDQIRTFPTPAELDSFTPELRVSYLASHAVLLASVRDFASAHEYIRRAYAVGSDPAWAASCHSDVLGLEDKWEAALRPAEAASVQNPGAPYAAHSLAQALLHLGRIEESAARLSDAARQSQSHEVVLIACWHLCALAETVDGDARARAALAARTLVQMLPELAPLADRETESAFARTHLDIATLLNDQNEIELWAEKVKSRFHRTVLDNLRHATRRTRLRLCQRRTIQKHQTCLPTSMASVLSAFGANVDPDLIAKQITFGGTSDWAAADWLEKNGYVVRFLIADPELAQNLIRNGIPFVLTLEWDHNAHAVAVIGIDEGAGTLLIHDPQEFRTAEYLTQTLNWMKAPLGPRGMIAVPPVRAALIDELLPAKNVELMSAAISHRRAADEGRPAAAREIVAEISRKLPQYPGTRFLQAFQARNDGRIGAALQILQELYLLFPESPVVRSQLIAAYRSAGDSALLRSALQRIVEEGTVPGIESQHDWLYPPARYVCEYADLLRRSAETSARAERLLHSVLTREPGTAEAWHILADLLWNKHEGEAALLCYRFGSCLAPSSDHYAVAYCDALANCGRKEEGLAWLEARVRSFADSPAAIHTWISWIGALENWGHPERALRACEEGLAKHLAQPELLSFAVGFFARMGDWDRAQKTLHAIRDEKSYAYLSSAVEFHRMKGELELAIRGAERWVELASGSDEAKNALLELLEKHDGSSPAIEVAQRWVKENPGNDYLEQVYLGVLDRSSASKAKEYRLLLNRLKRNPEDGWAWRDITFRMLRDYQSAGSKQQPRIERRIVRNLAECLRTSAEEPGTIRAQAEWLESKGEWERATDMWLQAIDRDPTHMYAYRHAIACSSRLTAEKRWEIWQRMQAALRVHQGRWSNAHELVMLAAERYGLKAAEAAAFEWLQLRPDDPDVIEAAADLLLTQGHGRSDAERALDLLRRAVDRFPFHFGLRFSLSDALRDVGDFSESERVLEDIASRHPDNSAVKARLALVRERHGRIDDALDLLQIAAAADPRNAELARTRAGILIRAGRLSEARSFVLERLQAWPDAVGWRKNAIEFLIECGDEEAAVDAARAGVEVYPHGAYLWMILGETLNRLPSKASPGEVEQCFRRSVEFNHMLFEAADWLAYVLSRQRRYSQAEELMTDLARRMPNPSGAEGRIAWIRRSEGKKAEALEQMVSVLRAAPWYSWGWSMLITWLEEDQAWEKTRALLSSTPEEMRTNTEFRRKRLLLLGKAGITKDQLDAEWDSLLQDFPEDVPLHLLRYDSLCDAQRLADGKAVLGGIEPVARQNPYVLARRVEVQARDSQKQQAIDTTLRVFFMENEETAWPVNHVWESIQKLHCEREVYENARKRMEDGNKLTPRALYLLACHAARTSEHATSRRPVSLLASIVPNPQEQEVKRLLRIVSKYSHFGPAYRAILLSKLSDLGEQRAVLRYWNRNREQLRDSIDCWSQAGRALIDLGRKGKARELMQDWRQHKGVTMWMVTNYVLCFSKLRRAHLEELASTCSDALEGLEHDHCAKYLAHRLAEAAALLDTRDEFLKTWRTYRNYFDTKLETREYFRNRDKYLLGQISEMAEALDAGRIRDYQKAVNRLKRKSYTSLWTYKLKTSFGGKTSWWRFAWILVWMLLWILSRFLNNSQ